MFVLVFFLLFWSNIYLKFIFNFFFIFFSNFLTFNLAVCSLKKRFIVHTDIMLVSNQSLVLMQRPCDNKAWWCNWALATRAAKVDGRRKRFGCTGFTFKCNLMSFWFELGVQVHLFTGQLTAPSFSEVRAGVRCCIVRIIFDNFMRMLDSARRHYNKFNKNFFGRAKEVCQKSNN